MKCERCNKCARHGYRFCNSCINMLRVEMKETAYLTPLPLPTHSDEDGNFDFKEKDPFLRDLLRARAHGYS